MNLESERATKELDEAKGLALVRLEQLASWGLQMVVEELGGARGPENLERDFEPQVAERLRSQLRAVPTPRRWEVR